MLKTGKLMWIPWVDPEQAEGKVAELYAKVQQGRGGTAAPATALVYSLRPELGMVKDDFRNAVVDDNTLGSEWTDLVNIAVSGLNACSYCASAHAGTLIRQHGTNEEDVVAMYRDWRSVSHEPKVTAMLEFAEKLTYAPWSMTEDDLETLRQAGFSDENIVDIVNVTAYRNFINRVHIALGLSPEGMRQRIPNVVDAILAETAVKQTR
jgi:uncharacterized peroxidase-related enzyme